MRFVGEISLTTNCLKEMLLHICWTCILNYTEFKSYHHIYWAAPKLLTEQIPNRNCFFKLSSQIVQVSHAYHFAIHIKSQIIVKQPLFYNLKWILLNCDYSLHLFIFLILKVRNNIFKLHFINVFFPRIWLHLLEVKKLISSYITLKIMLIW